ncbi:MAG TPA: STAS domain-containing protein [Sporichthyaceae bacterium]|nr:STAS domain-containing protein [Sporichthyaceae bacterium]
MEARVPDPDPTAESASAPRARAGKAERLTVTDAGPGEVVLRGEIDLATAPQVHAALEAAGGGPALMVDLTGVTYLGSAGVAELFEHAETNRMTVRVRGGSPTAKVVAICALEIVATVEILDGPGNPSQIPARTDLR